MAAAPNTANNDGGKNRAHYELCSILLFAEMRIIGSQKYCVVCRHVIRHWCEESIDFCARPVARHTAGLEGVQ
jgi:hypothetical protein